MSPKRSPQRVTAAVGAAIAASSPRTALAAVQACWREAVGEETARRAQPVSERDGTVTIACESSTWAHELDLMGEPILERLKAAIAKAPREDETPVVQKLRFTADAARYPELG